MPTRLGCGAALALALCVATACKDDKQAAKKDSTSATSATTVDPATRCQQLATACGEQPKHISKIAEECTAAAAAIADATCVTKVFSSYSCYEQELCGKGDKVWALKDLAVLAERHGRCVPELTAARDCAGK